MNHAREVIRCEAAYRMGLTGRGIGVAVLDTGIYLHEDFEHRVAAFTDMVHRRREPYDDNGHGTHISGIIGGSGNSSDGRYQGVAPECHIIMVKVLDQKGNGYASDVLAGIKWIRENRERLGIRIVNISVGSFSKKGIKVPGISGSIQKITSVLCVNVKSINENYGKRGPRECLREEVCTLSSL